MLFTLASGQSHAECPPTWVGGAKADLQDQGFLYGVGQDKRLDGARQKARIDLWQIITGDLSETPSLPVGESPLAGSEIEAKPVQCGDVFYFMIRLPKASVTEWREKRIQKRMQLEKDMLRVTRILDGDQDAKARMAASSTLDNCIITAKHWLIPEMAEKCLALQYRLGGMWAKESELDFALLNYQLSIPRDVVAPAVFADVNIEAERLFERALDIQEDKNILPWDKAHAWCNLAGLKENNPYSTQAASACDLWRDYWHKFIPVIERLDADYKKLVSYLELKRKSPNQKYAALNYFYSVYRPIERDWPTILPGGFRAMADARRSLEKAKVVSLPPEKSLTSIIAVGRRRALEDVLIGSGGYSREKSADIPQIWRRLGLDSDLSFNEYIALFKKLGLEYEVIKEPGIYHRDWRGRRVLWDGGIRAGLQDFSFDGDIIVKITSDNCLGFHFRKSVERKVWREDTDPSRETRGTLSIAANFKCDEGFFWAQW
jgi:hypothetical protein